jgi:hypothetical protein
MENWKGRQVLTWGLIPVRREEDIRTGCRR